MIAVVVVRLQWRMASPRNATASIVALCGAAVSGATYAFTGAYYCEYVLVLLLHGVWWLQAGVNKDQTLSEVCVGNVRSLCVEDAGCA